MAMIALHSSLLLHLVMPEVILTIAALIALTIDVTFLRSRDLATRFSFIAGIGCLGCLAAIAQLRLFSASTSLLDGVLITSPLIRIVQIVLIALAVATLWLALSSKFTHHVGEFVLLILMATVGMMFLVATLDLLVIFIALELLSLSLYILAGLDKHDPRSSEAAFKYFLFGGISAAFLLYGFSLLYGLSNSTSLVRIASSVHGAPLSPLLIVALVATVIGLGTKIAAAPLHFWAPDVYQAAPLPSAAFIASASRVASFFVLFQVMAVGFSSVQGDASHLHSTPGWVPVLAVLAAASMVLGNLVAIVQTSVRRLLAYSAIAHAGYMLIAVMSHSSRSLTALLFYLVSYALATLGAFAVISAVEQQTGGDSLAHFAGLSRRAPLLSICLLIFLLSLAGVPPLAGFFAKFYLFSAALAGGPQAPLGLLWLVVLALAMSAVSLYYYLQVLKRVFVMDPPPGSAKLQAPISTVALAAVIATAVLLLGCAPDLLLRLLSMP
jgi:NADH-quinone oxidoreductase subunit N